ncbi:MAG: type I-E CRISPR-associated protein Cas6/Cse3/CasE [Deltaproteobacteria bacterium]|nr:type I-E CRISPR-associated protein Cas6/Cse3/CasE [Deltaproteobacteria bacterium]
MKPLYLIRAPVDMAGLARCAGERGWLRYRGHEVGFDEGRALHHVVSESFGPGGLRPFRLLVPPGSTVGSLYGYSRSDAETLRRTGGVYALPEHLGVLDMEQLVGKAMPGSWKAGQRIGFDLRARPVRRLSDNLGRGPFRKGAEVDAFLVMALRRFPDDPAGTAGSGRTREPVYLDWLAERLAPFAELDRQGTRLVRFQRARVSRGKGPTEGPDATFHGVLSVKDPERFSALLARGVGRHRAYGYGMLLLRPPTGSAGRAIALQTR